MITKDFILEYFYKDGIINKSRCAENYLRKHPEPVEIKRDGRIKVVD